MWKIQKHLFSVVFMILCGCVSTATDAPGEMTQQQAMEKAIEITSMSIPEISGSQVPPSNIHAEKMTLEEAVKRLNSNLENVSEKSAESPVWLVSMDGLWLPVSAPGLTQKPYRHASIVLDAKTGVEVFRNMQP